MRHQIGVDPEGVVQLVLVLGAPAHQRGHVLPQENLRQPDAVHDRETQLARFRNLTRKNKEIYLFGKNSYIQFPALSIPENKKIYLIGKNSDMKIKKFAFETFKERRKKESSRNSRAVKTLNKQTHIFIRKKLVHKISLYIYI